MTMPPKPNYLAYISLGLLVTVFGVGSVTGVIKYQVNENIPVLITAQDKKIEALGDRLVALQVRGEESARLFRMETKAELEWIRTEMLRTARRER